MNKNRLLILAKLLEMAARNDATPKLGFNMGSYGSSGSDRTGHNCGTVACIAGWAVVAFRPDIEIADLPSNFRISSEAADLLGLDRMDASNLFLPPLNLWKSTPLQAASVLRHAAKTGVIDWSVADRVSN